MTPTYTRSPVTGVRTPWPRPPDHLAGVPIHRCRRCGVAFVRTTRLCPWCGTGTRVSNATCPRGHPLIGRNVVLALDGHRRCRTCRKHANLRRYLPLSLP